MNLLLSAATAYDNQFKSKSTKRQVFLHQQYDDIDEDQSDTDPYDIDASVTFIQANAHDQRQRTPNSTSSHVFMPCDWWFGLSDSDRKIWDQLDVKAKAVILGTGTPTNTPNQRFTPCPRPPEQCSRFTPPCCVNLHDISAFDFLQANLHHVTPDDDSPDSFHDTSSYSDDIDHTSPDDNPTDSATCLINAATSSGSKLPPGDIRRVLSKASKCQHSVNVANVIYNISAHQSMSPHSLVDRGANGGLAGSDVRIIHHTHRSIDVHGIDNHQLTDIAIGTIGGVVTTNKGPAIVIMHQYALLGKGYTIHSPGQLEWFKNDVNDQSIKTGGLQCITTLDGYILPLSIHEGLPRLDICPHTNNEWDSLPHIFLTGETDWDPSVLDHDPLEHENWADAICDLEADPTTNLFDEFGDYRKRIIVQHAQYFVRQDGTDLQDVMDQCIYHAHATQSSESIFYDAFEHLTDLPHIPPDDPSANSTPNPRVITTHAPDYQQLRPFFGWLSTDIIKKTFQKTTQLACLPTGTTLLKRSFKSSNPAMNVSRCNEAVACDIVYADVPTIYDGATAAVLFVGYDTHVTDVYGIKTDCQFVNTLEAIFVNMALLTNSSVTGLRLKLATKFLVFYAPLLLVIGKVSLINNNRIQQSAVTKLSSRLPTV